MSPAELPLNVFPGTECPIPLPTELLHFACLIGVSIIRQGTDGAPMMLYIDCFTEDARLHNGNRTF